MPLCPNALAQHRQLLRCCRPADAASQAALQVAKLAARYATDATEGEHANPCWLRRRHSTRPVALHGRSSVCFATRWELGRCQHWALIAPAETSFEAMLPAPAPASRAPSTARSNARAPGHDAWAWECPAMCWGERRDVFMVKWALETHMRLPL